MKYHVTVKKQLKRICSDFHTKAKCIYNTLPLAKKEEKVGNTQEHACFGKAILIQRWREWNERDR